MSVHLRYCTRLVQPPVSGFPLCWVSQFPPLPFCASFCSASRSTVRLFEFAVCACCQIRRASVPPCLGLPVVDSCVQTPHCSTSCANCERENSPLRREMRLCVCVIRLESPQKLGNERFTRVRIEIDEPRRCNHAASRAIHTKNVRSTYQTPRRKSHATSSESYPLGFAPLDDSAFTADFDGIHCRRHTAAQQGNS